MPSTKADRPRRWVVGLSSLMGLALAVTAWLLLRDTEYVAPSPDAGAQSGIQPAAAAAVLEELADAVATGDQAGAARLAAGTPQAERGLRALVSNAQRIPVEEVDLRYLGELGGQDAAGEWRAAVDLTWRYGPDRSVSRSEVEVRFGRSGDEVSIVSVGGTHARSPVWVTGPVEVSRGARTLVVAADRVRPYPALAREAVRVVNRVLPGWRSPLVVEVPASADALDRALGAEPGTYEPVAGVTAVPDGTSAPGSPVHVFLNPERMAALRAEGAQVVVSHEAAHVALDATSTSSGLPVWLTEGVADYVALRDVDLPLATTAGQIIGQVRRQGPPEALPDEQDFDDESRYFGASYEASWLACRMLAERAGERELIDFYRRAAHGADFGRAFRDTFGLGLPAFTRQWRQALSDLAA